MANYLAALMLCLAPSTLLAQGWPPNGTPVCDTAASPNFKRPIIAADGYGGAYIVWTDSRNQQDYDIFAQRIDGEGTILWTKNGIGVCTAAGNQEYPEIVQDGKTGFFIAWEDARSMAYATIYLQKLDPDGNPKWQNNGIEVSSKSGAFIEIDIDGL